MSELPPWALEKAREWLTTNTGASFLDKRIPGLAALLVEVVRDKQYEQWCSDQHVIADELSKRMAEVAQERAKLREALIAERTFRQQPWNRSFDPALTDAALAASPELVPPKTCDGTDAGLGCDCGESHPLDPRVECDECDGCGWYEGGKTLRTKCGKCKGTGRVPAPPEEKQG